MFIRQYLRYLTGTVWTVKFPNIPYEKYYYFLLAIEKNLAPNQQGFSKIKLHYRTGRIMDAKQ